MKKLILALLVAALCMVAAPAIALDWDDVPGTATVFIEYPYVHDLGTYFDVTLVDEGQDYPGWCTQTGALSIKNSPYEATLTPTIGESQEWNKVNWILNNKGGATAGEIQTAIWIVLGQGFTPGSDTAVVWDLVNSADPNFNDCSPGNVGAVLVVAVDDDEVDSQDLIIELPCPPEDIPTPEFPTMMIPVFFVGSMLVAASVLKKE